MDELLQALNKIPDNIDYEYKKTKLDLLKAQLKGSEQDIGERKSYAQKIFVFLSVFTGIMLLIVILCGLKVLDLDELIVITLISTTSANVIGIFIYVAKYLFKSK